MVSVVAWELEGFVALRPVGSSFLDQGWIPCPLHWQWSLNHWTTREAPQGSIFTWLYSGICCVDFWHYWSGSCLSKRFSSISFSKGLSWFSLTYLIVVCLPWLNLFLLLTHSQGLPRGEVVWRGEKSTGFGSRLVGLKKSMFLCLPRRWLRQAPHFLWASIFSSVKQG